MKRLFVLFIFLALSICAGAQVDAWTALRAFEGKWEGSSTGKPGTGTTTREYYYELNNHFLAQRDKSVYQPADPKANPLVHEDFGMFSYDASRKKVLWEQFHSEGFVNQYELESVSPDAKEFTFVTTNIENFPGARAKKLYRFASPDEIEETFWLAPSGKDFAVYTVAHIKRVK